MKNALFLISLLAVACIVLAHHKSELKQKCKHAFNKCLRHYPNIKREQVIDFIKKHQIPESCEKKCFAACFFLEIGWIKDGNVDWKKVKSANAIRWKNQEDIEKANQVADTCSEVVSRHDDLCELAASKIKCCVEESKKVYLPEPEMDFEE